MDSEGRRWTVRDRHGSEIYLTEERWQHIIEPINHPEMSAYEDHLKETIQKGEMTPNNYIVTAYQKEIG